MIELGNDLERKKIINSIYDDLERRKILYVSYNGLET